MAKTNLKATSKFVSTTTRTHEGAPAAIQPDAITQLRRLTLAHLLWEDNFYVDGQKSADALVAQIHATKAEDVATVAREARSVYKLRHVPLLLVRELARHAGRKDCPGLVRAALADVIQRPDELTEFLSIYWRDGKQPLSAQVKRGLADAFRKFNVYSLAKYDRDEAIKLRDVMFLTHPKPGPDQNDALYKQVAERTLPTPDTWETRLSGGADKKATFTELVNEGKLGALATLRNLRNMAEAGVENSVIRRAITTMKTDRVLPFRFIAAARYAPKFEPELEQAMYRCLEGTEKLAGRTVLLVDVSGSMDSAISAKSEMLRLDAAYGLAILLREICDDVDIATFSTETKWIPPRRGFALRDALHGSQAHSSTNGFGAVAAANTKGYDRLICITDEQWSENGSNVGLVYAGGMYHYGQRHATTYPLTKSKNYMINVAANQNGVGYANAWLTVTGWSEGVVRYIQEVERSHV